MKTDCIETFISHLKGVIQKLDGLTSLEADLALNLYSNFWESKDILKQKVDL